jgi:hypothetical protein
VQHRLPANEVTKGLDTISDKIRALGRAGYDRVEISKLLDIRYQHVRQVLIQAGIRGGLRRQLEIEREPVTIDAEPALRQTTSWEVLLHAGFALLGEWASTPEKGIRLAAAAPAAPGVYAFVLNDVIVYVGLSHSGLKRRMDQYRRGHLKQRTSTRVRQLIVNALANGQRIKVVVAMPLLQEWNGLPVNTAAGLEAGLIQLIRPEWNILGAT